MNNSFLLLGIFCLLCFECVCDCFSIKRNEWLYLRAASWKFVLHWQSRVRLCWPLIRSQYSLSMNTKLKTEKKEENEPKAKQLIETRRHCTGLLLFCIVADRKKNAELIKRRKMLSFFFERAHSKRSNAISPIKIQWRQKSNERMRALVQQMRIHWAEGDAEMLGYYNCKDSTEEEEEEEKTRRHYYMNSFFICVFFHALVGAPESESKMHLVHIKDANEIEFQLHSSKMRWRKTISNASVRKWRERNAEEMDGSKKKTDDDKRHVHEPFMMSVCAY